MIEAVPWKRRGGLGPAEEKLPAAAEESPRPRDDRELRSFGLLAEKQEEA